MKTVDFARRASRVLSIFLLAALAMTCRNADPLEDSDVSQHNLVLKMGAYDTPAAAAILPTTRIFAFHRGAPNDKSFQSEILNLTATANQLSARVKEGDWYLAMVSAPAAATFSLPSAATTMEHTPLYAYAPAVNSVTGKSANAEELFIANAPVSIRADQVTNLGARLDRNVAMVELIVNKVTANFNKAATDHVIELHHVPSTISYTGALLPDKNNPDTVAAGQFPRARVTLKDHPTESGYLHADTIRFLVPAHRGVDFSAANPVDTTTAKMLLSVNFQRTGGGRFTKSKEIPVVAKCNRVLRLRININDGISFQAETLPWSGVDVSETVGEAYTNWLYVKRGSGGTGQSWADPLPDISSAITTARMLRALPTPVPVNGILVAGGTAIGAYEEDFTLQDNEKIFGGWQGVPGTELSATDLAAPYTSASRSLGAYKAIIVPKTTGIALTGSASVLDGVVLRGVAGSFTPLTVNNPTAWINAVEVRENSSTAPQALSIAAGLGTNILVADNHKGGVALAAGSTLVNATIAGNAEASTFAGKLQNSIYWGNGGTPAMGGTIQYSAFNKANTPVGLTNIVVNENNTAWFTTSEVVPGPHFALSAHPRYAVSASASNRAPMLGRGERSVFDNVTTAMTDKRDIDGHPRHNDSTDIGCYEGVGSVKGFKLRWNMSAIYISTKANNESEHPSILVENPEKAYVKWHIDATSIISSRYSVITGKTAGEGNTTNLGFFKLKSATANSGNDELPCGTVTLHSNLGAYLPDVALDVFQTPGKSKPWTTGYAGSFHRNSETSERLISGTNSGDWTVRIVSGVDWIKIDNLPSGSNGGTVQETFGGQISGTGNIYFRVGMETTLPAGHAPRYGLITIHRTGGVALFFVRQGEEADYIYGPDSPGRTVTPPAGRPDAVKFSPYNLTDPQGRFNAAGVALGRRGGAFTDYPSKTGYFFKFCANRAFYPDNSIAGTNIGEAYTSYWVDGNEPCPTGYHTPSNPEFVESYFLNKNINTYFSGDANTTFVWGRLADGYFDRHATSGAREYGKGPNRATEGLLIYNDYNNACVFFPMAGKRLSDPPGDKFFERTATSGGGFYVQWTLTNTIYSTAWVYGTHSYGTGDTGHLGLSCGSNEIYKKEAASVRCVKD
ncbi:MAG: hypothetical protein LBI96_01965 [Odoribacteraceae bacterium]|jgi:hypothetical protein|nr:hypothetical protein [Odoribacteraceae bacterium]